jgi:hypothetical protein
MAGLFDDPEAMNKLMQSPLVQMGLGILSNNKGQFAMQNALGGGAQGLLQSQELSQRNDFNAIRKQQLDMQKTQYDQQQEQSKVRSSALGGVAQQHGIDQNLLMAYPEIGQKLVENKLIPKASKLAFAPNGVAYDENNPNLKVGENYSKTTDRTPSAVQEYEYAKGQGYGGSYLDFQLAQKKAGASNTNVTVGTDKKYGEILGSKLAEQDASSIDAARSAPDRLRNARNVKNILTQNPITGTGAEWRLGANKALATAGLIDGEQVKTTEDLASTLAAGTLDAIKTSGLGGGQGFTDKDRQFLEKARSGNIEINAGTLKTLADMNERAAIASMKRGNDVIKAIKADPNSGNVGSRLEEIPIPEDVKPQIKTVSLKDIADTAKASGKTTAQVTKDLKAKGYSIGK